MTSITATTGTNPLVQPLSTGSEEQRVANVTRNPDQDNVAARAPEAPDESAPRNTTQSATEPQDEINRRDDPQLQARTPERGTRDNVTVTPSEDNVDSGDRSENSVTVTITGPEDQEASATFTREQVFDGVEQRQNQQNAERFREASQNANDRFDNSPERSPAPGPSRPGSDNDLLNVIIRNSDSQDEARETAVGQLETRQSFNNAQFAFEQIENANDRNDSGSNNGSSSGDGSAAETARRANEAETKNTLLSSFLDNQQTPEQRLGLNINAVA